MKTTATLFLLFSSLAAAADPVRVEITRDNWVSSYPSETEGNNGASPKLKFKGIQEFALIDIDAAALKGKRVTRARLHLHGLGEETLGRMTVSTLADEWVEGDATGYKKTPGASCFAWSRLGERRWGGDQPDITGVINGAGGSIWGFADATARDAEGWQTIAVDPAVVQSRIDGRASGFCVMDDVGSEYTREGSKFTYRPFLNRYASSINDKRSTKPYFMLWLEDGGPRETPAPAPSKPAVKAAMLLAPAPEMKTSVPPAGWRDEFGEPLSSLEFFAAKGETISFSVAGGAKVEIAGVKARTFAMPLVEGREDPLVPSGFQGAPAVPDGGATCVEIHVPRDAARGRVEGKIITSSQTFPFALTVWDFTLPDHLSFIPQMNCYSLPGHEMSYYRLAHEHRAALNCLPYHWNGRIDDGPKILADGSWDWSAWDTKYATLFDGSAFADLPRGRVPVEAFYLTLNENWPMPHDAHFKGGYWIEHAYDDAYWPQFREAAARIARHLAEKGWSETMFEFYLNNKVSGKSGGWEKSTAAWILDEPSNTQDFWALRRYGQEFWQGVAAHPGARLVYRADISRPQWQRDLLDGVTNVDVISGALRVYHERVRERARRHGTMIYMYGSANALGTPNVANAAWCVEAWALGADGVVPWQTIGNEKSWQKPDELSLFYPTTAGPVPSLRLKTFRAGQQLVEYLTQFTALSGETREGVAAAVLAEPGLRARTIKANDDDAGKSSFDATTHRSLTALRARLGHWLDAKAPPPRERWHDPRPRPHDAASVRHIEVLKE